LLGGSAVVLTQECAATSGTPPVPAVYGEDVRRTLLLASFLALLVVLAVAMPAGAKMPPWTCELSTTRPVVGQPVIVEVRYWWDADHTEPAAMAMFRRLRHTVEARAIDHGEPGEYDLGVIPIVLPRVNPSTYRGEIVFPDTRRFRISGCGGGYDRYGYPRRAGVVVRPRPAARVQSDGSDLSITIALPLVAACLVLTGTIAARHAARHPRPR
jgi:hypothetical protein